MTTLFLVFFFQLAYLFAARHWSKSASTDEDYFLAGRSVGLFPLTMTFMASLLGGGVVLGASEEAYVHGWKVMVYPLGAVLGLLVFSAGIGSRMSSFKISTVAELFELVYGSPFLRTCASCLSIISLFMILIAQITASFKCLAGIGIESTWLFILFWALVIYYTSQGGIKAVIIADIFQVCFFSGIFLFCFLFINYFLPTVPLSEGLQHDPPSLSKLSGWFFMPLMFILIEQDLAQRCLSGRTPKIVSKAAFLSGLGILAFSAIPISFGCLAFQLQVPVPEGSSVLIVLMQKMTHPLLTALVGCAILAALISTASSLINAISSNVVHDFSWPVRHGQASQKTIKLTAYTISSFAVLAALYFNNILSLLIQSYGLSVSCLFVSVMFALFKRKGFFISALLSFFFGAFSFFLLRFFELELPLELVSVVFSLVGFIIGEALSVLVLIPSQSQKIQ